MKIEYTEYIIKKHIPEFLRLRIRKRRKPHHVTSDLARATVAVVIAVEPGGFATQLRRNTRAPSSNRTKTAARWCMAHRDYKTETTPMPRTLHHGGGLRLVTAHGICLPQPVGRLTSVPDRSLCFPRLRVHHTRSLSPTHIYTASRDPGEAANKPREGYRSSLSCRPCQANNNFYSSTMAASHGCCFFFHAEPVAEHGMPALDSCALCAKHLARDSDVFMYRGDTPFCSEDCRYEQMQLDAIRARRRAAGRRQAHSAPRTESWRGQQETAKVPAAS
jgi:hypothetical protein